MSEEVAAAAAADAADQQPQEEQEQQEAPQQPEDVYAGADDGGAAAGEQPAGEGALKRGREDDGAAAAAEEPEAKRLAGGGDDEAAAAGQQQQEQVNGDAAPAGAADAEDGTAEGAAGEAAAAQDGVGEDGQPAAQQQQQQAAAAAAAAAGPPVLQEGLGSEAHEDGTVSEKLGVKASLVGRLIGKAGATISQLQLMTGTSIQIDQADNPEHPDTKVVTVRGAPAGIMACKVEMTRALEDHAPGAAAGAGAGAGGAGEAETEEKTTCPAHIVGRIIGRGGETIRALQQACNVYILVDQTGPEGADRVVSIKGPADGVQRAMQMIQELVAGEPGSATAIIQKYAPGQSITITCPRIAVGRVIGKGGETIKMLQRRYNASIQVEQGGDPTNIHIAGPPGHIQACEREIQALILDLPPYGGGGPGFGRPPFGAGPFNPYGGAPGGMPYGAGYGMGMGMNAMYGGYGAAAYGAPGAGYGGYPAAAAGAYGGYGAAAAGGYGAGYGAAGGMAVGGAAAGGAAAGGAAWQAIQDDQGRTYYYNSATGVSQWEKPAEMA